MKLIHKIALIVLISFNCQAQIKNFDPLIGDTDFEIQNNLLTIFKKGENNYACFRIPALITTKDGTILAFAEARKISCSDTGQIEIVMKKSTDNGLTWTQMHTVFSDGKNVCGNPAPVVDMATGTIHLLSTWNYGEDHESEIIAGTSKRTREIYHQFSTDNGGSWSEPQNITESVKLPSWTWYATGPGHGIQLKNGIKHGRLIIPCDHITRETKKYYSHIIYSDDSGVSWKLGGSTEKDQVNECTVVELENGNLYLNMRNYDRSIKARQIAYSFDGGMSWKDQQIEVSLPDPICQGSIIKVKRNNHEILIFSNPKSSTSRNNLSLSLSRDFGTSWNEKIELFSGPSAYSDVTETSNKNILVLFEAGLNNPYEGIHLKQVRLK